MSEVLQSLQLISTNVGPVILLKPEDEEPAVALVGSHQCSGATPFATACKPNALFDNATPKVGINQALSHLSDRRTQGTVGQFRLAHPAAKVPGLENSPHD